MPYKIIFSSGVKYIKGFLYLVFIRLSIVRGVVFFQYRCLTGQCNKIHIPSIYLWNTSNDIFDNDFEVIILSSVGRYYRDHLQFTCIYTHIVFSPSGISVMLCEKQYPFFNFYILHLHFASTYMYKLYDSLIFEDVINVI